MTAVTACERKPSNEKQFRGGLVFKARRLVVSLNSRPRVIKKKKRESREREREVRKGRKEIESGRVGVESGE